TCAPSGRSGSSRPTACAYLRTSAWSGTTTHRSPSWTWSSSPACGSPSTSSPASRCPPWSRESRILRVLDPCSDSGRCSWSGLLGARPQQETDTSRGSGVLREPQVEATVARVEPARGHDLALGEEVHAFDTVGMGVAQQRVLPSAERVVGHRPRDRPMDPAHPALDLMLEASGRPAVVGEDGGAVAVRVLV